MKFRILAYVIFFTCLCVICSFVYKNFSVANRDSVVANNVFHKNKKCNFNNYRKVKVLVFRNVLTPNEDMYEYNVGYKKFLKRIPIDGGVVNVLACGINYDATSAFPCRLDSFEEDDKSEVESDQNFCDDDHPNKRYIILDIDSKKPCGVIWHFDEKY